MCLILCQSHFAYVGEGWQPGEWIEAKFMHHKLGTLQNHIDLGRSFFDGVAIRSKPEFCIISWAKGSMGS